MDKDINIHYQEMFDRLVVKHSFADEQDPNMGEKIARGAGGIDLIIPHLDTARTTLMVQKIMPDGQMGDEVQLPRDVFLDRGGSELFSP